MGFFQDDEKKEDQKRHGLNEKDLRNLVITLHYNSQNWLFNYKNIQASFSKKKKRTDIFGSILVLCFQVSSTH